MKRLQRGRARKQETEAKMISFSSGEDARLSPSNRRIHVSGFVFLFGIEGRESEGEGAAIGSRLGSFNSIREWRCQ